MIVIGLVGGIGSGKTTAATVLAELGAQVIHADLVGHEVYRPGTRGFRKVVETFGPSIVANDGTIDRGALGRIVFGKPEALTKLNAIVHPLIREEIEARIGALREDGSTRIVVLEAAILLEAGWRSLVDEVWVLTASPEAVHARLAAQRGMSPADVDARIARQASDHERRAAADRVIENSGSVADLREKLIQAWNQTQSR